MKDEREILTRQTILNKLVYEAKRSIVGSLLMCGLGLVLFGIMSFILLTPSYLTMVTKLIVGILPSFFYFIACAFFFIRALLSMNKAKRGEFTVVEDVLTEIKDNELSILRFLLYGRRYRLKAYLYHVFKFRSGKMFIANAEEYKNTRLGAAAEFSMPGDIFYLVFYNDNPNKIVLLFSSKTYAYKAEK